MIVKTVGNRPADAAYEKTAKGPLRTGNHPTDSAADRGATARLADASLSSDARLTAMDAETGCCRRGAATEKKNTDGIRREHRYLH